MFKVAGVHLEKILFFSWPNLCGDPRVLSPQNLNVLTKNGKKKRLQLVYYIICKISM